MCSLTISESSTAATPSTDNNNKARNSIHKRTTKRSSSPPTLSSIKECSSSSSISNQSFTKSGFEIHRTALEVGVAFLSVIYGAFQVWNPSINVQAQHCSNDGSDEAACLRPDLLGYKLASFLAMCYMGCRGFYRWYLAANLKQEYRDVKKNGDANALAEYRVLGKTATKTTSLISTAADDQNIAIWCYQIWDFVVSLTIPEHCDPIFLAHHALTAVTAYCSLDFQMVPFYSIYYGGCSEVSSIFLVLSDLDTLLNLDGGKQSSNVFLTAVLISQAMFVLTFFMYRVVGWIYYIIPMWKDCLLLLRNGKAEQERPGKSSFLYVFLTLSVVLGALQLYWLGCIIQKLMDMAA